MKRLPIGQSTLRKIIDSNCCYVDKTPFVKQLLDDNNGYWFWLKKIKKSATSAASAAKVFSHRLRR